MTTKKPASAGEKDIAETATGPRVIEGVSLIRLPPEQGKPSHPMAQFKGKPPKAGEVIHFTLENGVIYQGKVSEATEADGEVLAEFEGRLSVVKGGAS